VPFRDVSAADAHELVSIERTVEGGDFTGSFGVGTFTIADYRAYDERAQTLGSASGRQ
jgi:hypothetical protein